jgi:hypothetical protein
MVWLRNVYGGTLLSVESFIISHICLACGLVSMLFHLHVSKQVFMKQQNPNKNEAIAL